MRVTELRRHTVKSVGREALQSAFLTAGQAFPHDRLFAVTHARSGYDGSDGAWAPCESFGRVTHAPALAAVRARYDPASGDFEATRGDGARISANLRRADQRDALAQWVGDVLIENGEGRYAPPFALVAAGDPLAPALALTDSPLQTLSLKSHASRRALEAAARAPVELDRFRGNVWFDGDDLEPWIEETWIGRRFRLGGASIEVKETIGRCLATAANPTTGARDLSTLKHLRTLRDDPCFGVIAAVIDSGAVAVGDALTPL